MAQFVEMCVKEVRPSCIGFFQRQLRIFAQGKYVDQGETIPQCMKSMLAEGEEEKFPVFNKFVEKLRNWWMNWMNWMNWLSTMNEN